jgi:hypothetical protein
MNNHAGDWADYQRITENSPIDIPIPPDKIAELVAMVAAVARPE